MSRRALTNDVWAIGISARARARRSRARRPASGDGVRSGQDRVPGAARRPHSDRGSGLCLDRERPLAQPGRTQHARRPVRAASRRRVREATSRGRGAARARPARAGCAGAGPSLLDSSPLLPHRGFIRPQPAWHSSIGVGAPVGRARPWPRDPTPAQTWSGPFRRATAPARNESRLRRA